MECLVIRRLPFSFGRTNSPLPLSSRSHFHACAPCPARASPLIFGPWEPRRCSVLDRRSFLRASSGVAAGFALHPSLLHALASPVPPLPGPALYQQDEEAYWAQVRQQFLIPPGEVYLNNGTVGSSPTPVLQAIFNAYKDTEKMDQADPEDDPI